MLKYVLAAAVALFAADTAWSVEYIGLRHGYARISVPAAPQCGGAGTAKIAQKRAAVETIKDGFDRYEIVAVHIDRNPTTANMTCKLGPDTVSASRKQAFIIRLSKDGQRGSEEATPARKVLGPNWANIVKGGAVKCVL